MTEFNKGDKVRRINESYLRIEVGDEGIVAAHENVDGYGGGTLRLEGHYVFDDPEQGLQGYIADNFELVEPAPLFKAGDKVRSKAFGGSGRAIIAYYPTAKDARKVYNIAAGSGYGSDKPVVIYSIDFEYDGRQRVSWDFAESVEIVEAAQEPEPVKKDYTKLFGLADNLIFAYGITDPNGHTGDVLKQLVAALREETTNDNA